MHITFCYENVNEGEHLEALRVHKRIILKQIFKKQGGGCGLDSFGSGRDKR
jgi:hypothetical protein